jgi:glycosyltransferase involved in cell wall biosynthesis
MDASSPAIVHVIAQMRYGAGRYLVDTAIEQSAGQGHPVMICVSEDADEHWKTDPKLVTELAAYGIEVHVIGDFFHRRARQLHQSGEALRRICRKLAPAKVIVHAHTAMAAAVGHWAAPDALVVTCHGWAAGRPPDIDLQDSLAYQLCDAVVTYSRIWAERLETELAAPRPLLIPMGLNLARYPVLERRELGQERINLATICELTPRKGVDVLIQAMPAIWAYLPGANLDIIGHGDAARDLRLLADSVDPGSQRIRFHGAVAHPYSRLADTHLFVLASRSDNLPVVFLEAMLAGLPIVATDVGGASELISSAQCGKTVRPDSAGELAAAILSLASQEKSGMDRLGRKGEQFARSQFDVRETALRLQNVYYKALKS